MPTIPADSLALQCFYQWERKSPERVALTQPMGAAHGGQVREFTWAEVGDQVRRMATHLKSQG